MMINSIFDKIRLPFRKEKELYSSLYEVMGFYPHDISFYKQALMHKSLSRRNAKGKPVNNERCLLARMVNHISAKRSFIQLLNGVSIPLPN